MRERGLDGASGKSGRVRKRSETCRKRFPFIPRSLAIEMEKNHIGGRFLIVADQIAHEHVEDVIVDGNGLFETGISKWHVTGDEPGISSYTDKRTALSCVKRSSSLDGNGADELLSAIRIKQIKFGNIPGQRS